MCGICGVAYPRSTLRQIDDTRLRVMRDSMWHRGPDEADYFTDAMVGLAHRRLSIVDLAAGSQPMANEDGTVWIVYNGEVYNHRSLRPALEAAGHVYSSSSDTETIIHLYEEHGTDALQYLRGMFAFAIWDRKKRQLLLARDRLGIKPLYYTLTDEGVLWFASEIKALIEVGAIRAELNYAALPDYAANRATSGEETLFRGVKRLMPGHFLLWDDGSIRIEKYWDLDFTETHSSLSEHDYVEQFAELFRESVQLRLMADVPLGVFLSGGIDSSAIATVMSQMISEPLKSFSVAFDEQEANELAYSRLVAQSIGAEQHEVVVTPEQFFDSLPTLIYHEDEPIAHPSSVPLYFVSKLASDHVKVVLTGEGSDELLAGYARYRKTVYNLRLAQAYNNYVPAALRSVFKRAVEADSVPPGVRQKARRSFLYLSPDLREIYFDNFSVFSRSGQRSLFTNEAQERSGTSDPYSVAIASISTSNARTLIDSLLAADLKTYLHELLMKQDQMSMAASIESRVPFLDHKLVEFAVALPAEMKLRGLTTKYVLRKAMKGILPPAILNRRKMGFPVPVGKWLRGKFSHLLDEYVLSNRVAERRIFDPVFTRDLVLRHRAGEDHTERLWSLINFEMWQRRFIDGETPRKHFTDSASTARTTGSFAAAVSMRETH